MPRRAAPPKRRIPADPVYGSVLVQQLINKIMLDGKKSTAEKIVYDALSFIEERTGSSPVTVLNNALDNIRPRIEVKSRRVGGATYQVPIEVNPRRANTLALQMDGRLRPGAAGEDDGQEAGRRDPGRKGQRRDERQAARRHPPHGRSKPSICTLQVVIRKNGCFRS